MSEKRILGQVAGLLVLAAVTLTVPAVAQTSNVVSIPDGLAAAPDGNVTTAIMLINSTGVAAINITLSYNASVVNATNATEGDFTDYFLAEFYDAANGWIIINTYITGQDLTGNVTVAHVTLEAVGNPGDYSPLNLTINAMGNQTGYRITTGTTDNGSFVIQGMCGDVDCDTIITGMDVTKVFNAMYGGSICSQWAADVDCDTIITGMDVTKVFNAMYGGALNCCSK